MQDVIIWGIWVKGKCNLGVYNFCNFLVSQIILEWKDKKTLWNSHSLLPTVCPWASHSTSLSPSFSLLLDKEVGYKMSTHFSVVCLHTDFPGGSDGKASAYNIS